MADRSSSFSPDDPAILDWFRHQSMMDMVARTMQGIKPLDPGYAPGPRESTNVDDRRPGAKGFLEQWRAANRGWTPPQKPYEGQDMLPGPQEPAWATHNERLSPFTASPSQ